MTITNYKLYIVNPSAAINLCTNPSFETGTTGWATLGTNTIAKSAVQQRRGVYSCKVTYQDNDGLLSYSITLANTAHTASVDIYIPADYDGTDLNLTFANYTSATVIAGKPDMTIRDDWQRVHCHINPDAGDLAGLLYLSENGTNPTAGKFIYIDGVQIEAGAVPTTYFDGDSEGFLGNVLEYYWNGQQNASTSVRTANTRSGGTLVDIESYCKIIMTDGLGIAPVDNVAIPLTKGGERFLYSNLTSRYFNVRVVFKGSEMGAIQANRRAFVDLINPDKTAYNQPLILRYQGFDASGNVASDPVNIVCQYVSGLDQSPLMKFAHFADITFRLSGTALEVDGDSGVGLDFNDTLANANYIVKRDRDGVWSVMAGLTGNVYAIAQHPITKEIYIGGEGLNMGGDANADYLAKWNGTAWVSVVSGISASVRALAFDAAGNLYIGGAFTNLGDANGDNIVKWDGSSLSSLGTGMQGIGSYCASIAIDLSGNVYAGGTFETAGGVANTVRIAKWNGTAWSALSTGMSAAVFCITIDKSGNVYAGGSFTTAGGTSANSVAKWNGTAWSALGTGMNHNVLFMTVDSFNNLYAVGQFTTAGGTTVNYFAKWNGLKWSALGSGLNNTAYSIVENNNKIYLSGSFTIAGGVSLVDKIAVYLGNGIYQPLDINLPGAASSGFMYSDDQDNLYIGFSTSGSAETAGDDIVTNGGTAKTYPVITVTGPGLLRQIVNTTTGKGMYFNNLTLLSGEVITMDLRPGRISMTSTFRGSVLGYVLPGSSYDFPLMPGTNRIATFIDGTTDANTTATMQWVENYHGIDGAQYE